MKKKLTEEQRNTLNDINITENSLSWAYLSLQHYFVHKKAINFILDGCFDYVLQLDRCINFIEQTFKDMNGQDQFGLQYLGDSQLNIRLEEKSSNKSLKKSLLQSL